jgi:N-acetylglucosamine-6-phosphate deacetylase
MNISAGHRFPKSYLTFVFFIFPLLTFSQETVTGLFYSDNKPVSIEIKDGKILSVKKLKKLPAGSKELIIAPGLIDNQVNGFAGISFTSPGGELTSQSVKTATEALWKTGVTTYLPTLTTSSNEVLKKNFTILGKEKDDPSLLGSIAGFHLEGPYISPVDGYRGAHPLRYVRKPDWNEFAELNKASGNNILEVTLAPEIDGALDFISRCREAGIIVALGHHNASAAIVNEAVSRGASIATHIGNGCANMINRHINPIWPQLSDDRLMISMIGDGFHLLPEELRVFYKVKGPEKTIITSDVTSFASMQPGRYLNSENDTIELTREGMLRYPAQNVLAGSASPLKKGVANVMKVTGCSMAEAFRMASTNPARLYRLNDRGTLEAGKRADIILFQIIDNELVIRKTFVKGKLVYEDTEFISK